MSGGAGGPARGRCAGGAGGGGGGAGGGHSGEGGNPMKRPAWSQDLARFLSEVGAYMVIAARSAEFGLLLAIGVGFAPLMAESAPAVTASAPAAPAAPIAAALVPLVDLAKMMPGAA